MARDPIVFIRFVLSILSNSFRRSYSLSEFSFRDILWEFPPVELTATGGLWNSP